MQPFSFYLSVIEDVSADTLNNLDGLLFSTSSLNYFIAYGHLKTLALQLGCP